MFVFGKIRAIDAAVAQVHKGETSGDLLRGRPSNAATYWSTSRNTSANVRDLMAAIGARPPPPSTYGPSSPLRQEVFIGDYQELRARSTPCPSASRSWTPSPEIDTQPEQLALAGLVCEPTLQWG